MTTAPLGGIKRTRQRLAAGKRIGTHVYIHVSAIATISSRHRDAVELAASTLGITPDLDFNVIRLNDAGSDFSLLLYPGFFDEPFPELAKSWRFTGEGKPVSFRDYTTSWNPPILHRKELLLSQSHERYAEYEATTRSAEQLGLFAEAQRIGFREQWRKLIEEQGYELAGSQFVPLANTSERNATAIAIERSSTIPRHLTALFRNTLSAPVKALHRHGLLQTECTFFDYGCGRGDDVRSLQAIGITANGWDPHYAPEDELRSADVVNIGFVLNVIEEPTERAEALIRAYSLSKRVLSVAAMLSHQATPDGKPYRDGYVSSRGTFQKYYAQSQLRDYIEHTLDAEAIASGPGVFFVFRDKELEQHFLQGRYRGQGPEMGHTTRPPRLVRTPGNHRIPAEQRILQEHGESLAELWHLMVGRGRMPTPEEVPSELLSRLNNGVGSLTRAVKVAMRNNDAAVLNRVRDERTSELIVMFSTQLFQRRTPYKNLDDAVQRDVRAFFGDYGSALDAAKSTLFSIADAALLQAACTSAAQSGLGYLEAGRSLQLHRSLVPRLPAILRTYVACASALYGDLSAFDLVKIHIGSGKLTLLRFENFESSPLPRLVERVKVRLRDNDVDYFTYGNEHPPTLLFHKSRYINEEFPNYPELLAFEEALRDLNLFDLSGYGPSEGEFARTLSRERWELDDHKLVPARRVPELDEPCGRVFKYRDLIECGPTQLRERVPNAPRNPDSYTALLRLTRAILEPTIDYFGMIKLTYGFCGASLARRIKGGIAPALDQHAAHELNSKGRMICTRQGAACDFVVEDEDMWDVARWIHENTPVDRIYFYGSDRPIHVSYSNLPSGQLIKMIPNRNGRRIPHVARARHFADPRQENS
jgi:DNA phosphorothioation-associated putative methyltransferase